ncbi:MAG: DUF599 domain-containing protein [Pseudorhodoplanes sp.]|nr:DUF599 domain-containing protein [Pseudorhodoplanes sp.]
MLFSIVDVIAIVFFVGAWLAYHCALEFSRHGHDALNARMNGYRDRWIAEMLNREVRIVDTQIMGSLQNGTAFFASTSLLAIGGALTLLRASDDLHAVVVALPFAIEKSRALWEIKAIGLVVIFVYAFFKFAWAYRLFNYVAIMFGAMPPREERDTPEAKSQAARAAALFTSAGRNFNRGQRAFFFALGYLGWFIGPLLFIATTSAVVAVMWRRQFASDSRRALDL